MVEVRQTARALVTDPSGRALLIYVHDDVALDASDPVLDYWVTVGGGVEAGETFEQAIVREVFEETGHRIGEPASCIWRRRRRVTDEHGTTRESEERYFWCSVASPSLSTANLTDLERRTIREFRWWDLDDRDLERVRVFPEGFVAAAREIAEHGPPDAPIWL